MLTINSNTTGRDRAIDVDTGSVFVDETAAFRIAVCRLLIRFFSNRCAKNTIMHSIKYPF